jgi:hypothetical protein
MHSAVEEKTMNSNLNNRLNNVMTTEQFTQVVDAILEGKYSWACLLTLRFAGYNPLHYIPYRTYNRLMKDHCQNNHNKSANSVADHTLTHLSHARYSAEINDLSHLETLNERHSQIHGGNALNNYNASCSPHKFHYSLKVFSERIGIL